MNIKERINLAQKHEKPVTEAGRIEDADGALVRLDKVDPYDLERDQFVRELAQDAAVLTDELQAFKSKLSERLQSFITKLAEKSNVKLGGKQGNVTIFTYDRRFKIERSVQKRETTNEKVIVAKKMVNDCFAKWAKGANKNIQVVVEKRFKTDQDGNYNIQMLKEILNMPVGQDDPQWQNAMQMLSSAIQFSHSATYYRVYVRDENGNYHPLPLNFTDV